MLIIPCFTCKQPPLQKYLKGTKKIKTSCIKGCSVIKTNVQKPYTELNIENAKRESMIDWNITEIGKDYHPNIGDNHDRSNYLLSLELEKK